MRTSTLNHFAQLATEKLNNLKGELAYTQQVLLEQGLEAWEKKEYLQLEESYIEQIKEQEAHIEMMKEEGLW